VSRIGVVRRRVFGSVRVRVALVAGVAFAVTLIAASVLLLRTLESRLIDDIRASDQDALQAQAVRLLSNGLPNPQVTLGLQPVTGNGTVTYQVSALGNQAIVATATAGAAPPATGAVTNSADGPLTQDGSVAGTAEGNVFDTITFAGGSGFTSATEIPIDASSARLLGVAGQPGPFLMSTVRISPGLALTTASSLAEVDNTLSTTRTILWYAVPLLVLLVMGCAWLLVGRALRPVHTLTARAATITAQSLHERVPVSAVGDEVSELATTINSMLSRIETADISSRRLVSDASHELRTPIAVMRTELEVARRDPDTEWGDVSATLLGEVDRLQGLVDDLLLLARISERGAVAEPFSLLDAVRDVAGRRRSAEVSVATMGDDDQADVEIIGDSSAVQRALDHVAANATRHATDHVEVTLETERDDGLVAVHVDDDGPGIAEEDRERVLQRFERLDEARSRDAGGSGLGLAVATDVMAAHGGRVDIGDSPLGGTRVTLLMRPQPESWEPSGEPDNAE
jgi:signal transduction histidine kinase